MQIINYVISHCGSAHDSTVFHDSCTFKQHWTLFQNGEWIWADSAYGLDTWCLTPYKKPQSNTRENTKFNYHLSQVSNMIYCPIIDLQAAHRYVSNLNMLWDMLKAVSAPGKDSTSRLMTPLTTNVHWHGSKPVLSYIHSLV